MNADFFERTPSTADGQRALGRSWPKLERMVRRMAGRMTPAPDDQDDLVQTAMTEFYERDPSRFDLSEKDAVAWLRTVMVRKMWEVWGKDQGGAQRMADRYSA